MCEAWMTSRGQLACHGSQIPPWPVAGWWWEAYEVREDREALLGTTCSEPFMVVRNNDNTEGASYSPIQIPVKHSWGRLEHGLAAGARIACPQPKHMESVALRNRPASPPSPESTIDSGRSRDHLHGPAYLAWSMA